jgi:hypothetical protein
MGEKWWPNGTWDMHPGFFYNAANLRHGTDNFTSTPKEGFLSPFKNPKASTGFEPRELGVSEASTLPLHHRSC